MGNDHSLRYSRKPDVLAAARVFNAVFSEIPDRRAAWTSVRFFRIASGTNQIEFGFIATSTMALA
ncbi:hypothetical protein [Sphingomonas sp. 1185]|uniref:hypothetical protein n=1 Tax=Sphingomonas sp. 1185 TaxID=3156411 RepID=UPI0033948A18